MSRKQQTVSEILFFEYRCFTGHSILYVPTRAMQAQAKKLLEDRSSDQSIFELSGDMSAEDRLAQINAFDSRINAVLVITKGMVTGYRVGLLDKVVIIGNIETANRLQLAARGNIFNDKPDIVMYPEGGYLYES